MIACCGLKCTECEAFIATQNDDAELRDKVAREWSHLYKIPVEPEHINCTGCLSDGVKTYYCGHMCEIRKCVNEKRLQTCAGCNDYACEKLNIVFRVAHEAKNNLDNLR